MKIGSYQHGRGTVIAPREAVVNGECDALQRSILDALANGSSHIVLDLSEVPFIDSAGLELLCEARTTCSDGGAQLKLASVGEVCREILRITDLDAQFESFDTVEEAAKSVV